MQHYKKLVWVTVLSVAVCVIVLYAAYSAPISSQRNNGVSRHTPKPGDKPNSQQTAGELEFEQTLILSKNLGTSSRVKYLKSIKMHDLKNNVQLKDMLNSLQGSPSLKSKTRLNNSNTQTHFSPSKPSAGYIITQTYGGQMTRAIRNMMLQQCWGNSLSNQSLYIVEPFSSRSNLLHAPKFWSALSDPDATDSAPRFSDYYDIDFYNEYSIHNKSTPLSLWENFIAHAPRHAVAVVTPKTSCSSQLSNTVKDENTQRLSSSCSFLKPFRVLVEDLTKHGFAIERTICVTCNELNHPLTLEELYNEIYKDRKVTETTVLISSWRSFGFTSSWLQLPKYCQLGEDPSSSKRLIPSKSIISNTQYYKRNILKSDKVIAVMLRIERFLTLKATGRSDESVQSCINKTLALRDEIRRKRKDLSQSGTFLTIDIGRFGSGIMQNGDVVERFGHDSLQSIKDMVSKTVKDLYNGKYASIETWEDTFVEASGGVDERGYIAMLQRSIATESDCLILMGGGSFQQVAAFQYIKNHPDPSSRCLYSVCAADSFEKSVNNALSS